MCICTQECSTSDYGAFEPLNGFGKAKAGLESILSCGTYAWNYGWHPYCQTKNYRFSILTIKISTKLESYPIATIDKVRAMEDAISNESYYIPMGINVGIDPADVFLDEDREYLDTEKLHQNFLPLLARC